MKLGKAEFVKLRGALALLVLLTAAGGVGVYYVIQEKQKATRALATAETRRNQNETRLRQVSKEEQEIKTKSAQFQKMADRGIIGPEKRLDWVELLREIRDRQKLFEVDYEIAPQQKLDSPANGYEFQASSMRLGMNLLHEEDLLRLLAELRQKAKALVLPRECTLTRIARSNAERSGPQAQLKADCTLLWITVHSPEKKP